MAVVSGHVSSQSFYPFRIILKRFLITVAKFAMSFAILAYLFHKASKTINSPRFLASDKNWWWLALGLLACLIAHVIGFLRWRVMVRALDLPFTYFDAVRIGFIGLFFNLFAFGVLGGDALRAFYVTREFPDRKPEAIASVVADRMIGLLTMFLVASIAFLWLDTTQIETSHPQKLASIRYVCTLVVTVTTAGLQHWPRFSLCHN